MDEEFLAVFEELVAELRALLDGLLGQLVALDQNLKFSSQFLPMFWDTVRGVIEWAKAALDVFFTEVKHVIENHTPFLSLIVQAFNWLDNVKQPVSNLAAVAEDTTGNENLVKWKGDAWTTYKAKRDAQVTALTATSERADFVHTWLVGILEANIAYTNKVVQQLMRLGLMVAEIVKKAANPATAASAVGDLKELIVTVVETRVEEYSDIAQRLGAATRLSGEVLSNLSDHQTFPGGAWPQAVA